MQLTIFAATGRIGRHLLDQGCAAGHDITAVARHPDRLPADVHGVAADLLDPDPDSLADAVRDADGVLSALGPRSRAEFGIAARGTRAIVAAMKTVAVRRVVVVSAAPVSTVASPGRPDPPRHDQGEGFWMRNLLTPAITAMLGAHYRDLAVMEDVLRDSGLDWTAVRPPRLTDKPLTRTYRTAFEQNLRGGAAVPRADVADFMLSVLVRPDTIEHAIGIAT